MALLKMPLADFLSNKFDRDFEYLISILDDLVIRTAISKMLKGLIKSNSISLRATHLREIFELKDDFANIVDNPRRTRTWGNRSVASYMAGFRDTDLRFPSLQCLAYLGGFIKKTTRRHENYFPIEFIQIQLNDETARRCVHRWGPQENSPFTKITATKGKVNGEPQAPNRNLRPRPQPGPQYYPRKMRGPPENHQLSGTKQRANTATVNMGNMFAKPDALCCVLERTEPEAGFRGPSKMDSATSSALENRPPDDSRRTESNDKGENPSAPPDIYRLARKVLRYSELAPFKFEVTGNRVVYDFSQSRSATPPSNIKSSGPRDLIEGTSTDKGQLSPLLLHISDSSSEFHGWDSDDQDREDWFTSHK